MNWTAAFAAGVVAAVVSTVVEVLLWATFTDALPAILWRDGRFAAAIVLGPGVLEPAATFDARAMLVATLLHGALSIVYAVVLAALVSGLQLASATVVGALFGLALYAINLYGFTVVFPWFVVDRDAITLAAHVVFGVSASATYVRLRHRTHRR
jgi:hypothetical protein